MNHPFRIALLLAVTLPVQGLTVKGYNATDHDRFTGFPGAPVMNPDFIYDATKFTGVGWWVYTSVTYGTIYSPITAVSPRHLLCASHARPGPGTVIHFVDSTNTLVDRTVASFAIVPNDSMVNSDLCVITLTTPLPDTVARYPWQNLGGGEASYIGQLLTVLGQNPNGTPRGGQAAITALDDEDGALLAGTYHAVWSYNSAVALPNECALSPGDSGGPSFAIVGGQPALVGTHAAAGTVGPLTESLDTLLHHYATRVDTILEPSGHRLMPANFTATTLGIPAGAASPTTLRRFNPGEVAFSVSNTGADLTGNIDVTLTFPAGHEPDTLTSPGAVVEAAGTGIWNLRKATLAASTSLTFTANWAALPDLPAINASITADSDTAPAIVANPSFPLGPSYAEWADGLAMPGQTEDPDDDSLPNLLEYAIGGDPESGSLFLPGDHPLLPVMTESGGIISLSYPERDDAVLRGISYLVQTSTTLAGLSWSATLPPGASSSTAPFAPAVPGFLNRTVTWPSDGPRRFARVKVDLAE